MRKHFEGFSSAVDLDQIDTVTIREIPNRSDHAIEVVIRTRSNAEIPRAFISPDPDDTVKIAQMYADAQAWQHRIERSRLWGLRREKIAPHVLTALASVATVLV